MKSGNLNFLELSGPLQACNGTAFYSVKKAQKLIELYSEVRNFLNSRKKTVLSALAGRFGTGGLS